MAFTLNDYTKNATQNRTGRYVQGGLTDIYSNKLGWWERRLLPYRDDDFSFVVLENETARPDLISYRLYGKSSYAWLVLQYNNIVDPETELLPGTSIRMPTQSRLTLDIITKAEGGKII